ncbi:hypothetical protein F8S13_01825 [Chloroflexia bacterium SDU3-3]|nr:hypothetical protein F8S13_01825 [Chloroflexia bacterium SDU3-3]
MMRTQLAQICEQHPDPFDCPDMLVYYSPQSNTYGLIIHDGGRSSIHIDYCPWCGAALGKQKRTTA